MKPHLTSHPQRGWWRPFPIARACHLCIRDRHREQLSRPSTTAAPASTRWRSAATTSTGARDFELRPGTRHCFLRYGPPIHRTWLGADAMTGSSPTRPSHDFSSATSCRSRTCATSACPTGSATSRTPTSRAVRRVCARLRRAVSLGAALHAGQRDVHLRDLLGAYGWWNEQLTQRPGVRDGAQAHREGQRAGDAGDPRCPPRRYLHPERIVGIFSCRQPGGHQAGRDRERAAVSVAGPELRPPGRLRDVRVPDGQRHDARRVPLLPENHLQAPLHHGQRLLRHQRAPGVGRTAARGPPARSSVTTRSPGSTTTATACR